MDGASLLSELVEAASFLQVTSLLQLLLSQVRLTNCLELYRLWRRCTGSPTCRRPACASWLSTSTRCCASPSSTSWALLTPAPWGCQPEAEAERGPDDRDSRPPWPWGDFLGPLAPHPYQGEPRPCSGTRR